MSGRALRRTPGRERRGSVPSSARAPRVTLSAPCIEGNAWTYLKRCLDTGDVSAGGEYVARFEPPSRTTHPRPAVVATSTGTAALRTRCASRGRGRERRARPAHLRRDPQRRGLLRRRAVVRRRRPAHLERLRRHPRARPARGPRNRSRPRFAMVTHLYGVPADLDSITALCAREASPSSKTPRVAGLVVEGAAHRHFGRAAALSFNGNKIVTAGQGRAAPRVARDDAARARHLAAEPAGRAGYTHDEVRFNYRMANLNAALGLAQVESLPSLRLRRRAVQASYQIALEEIDSLALQGVPSGAEVNGWLQGVRVTARARCDRDGLLAALEARGVDARPVFQPMHRQVMFRGCGGACPDAEAVADTALNLPNGPETDVPRVIRALREVL
ncbi:MAG: DegT/DnrJ/EryC1/StrS family aminotransferase [Polyangiales bacterium]